MHISAYKDACLNIFSDKDILSKFGTSAIEGGSLILQMFLFLFWGNIQNLGLLEVLLIFSLKIVFLRGGESPQNPASFRQRWTFLQVRGIPYSSFLTFPAFQMAEEGDGSVRVAGKHVCAYHSICTTYIQCLPLLQMDGMCLPAACTSGICTHTPATFVAGSEQLTAK